jgi:polyketide synthase-associated protein
MELDFEIAGKDATEIGEELHHELWLKGYCLLEMGQMDILDNALDDVRELEAGEHFKPPPPQIVDGLLGAEGSSQWYQLSTPDVAAEGSGETVEEGDSLKELNQDHLMYIAETYTAPFFESMGMEGIRWTGNYILRGGEFEVGEEPTEMTEDLCSQWLSTFLHAKLCVIYFLGPGEGELVLEPLDEDAEPVKIKTRPDTLVIFRCDKMKHTHDGSTMNDYAIISWLVKVKETGPRGWKGGSVDIVESMPHVKELTEWADEHLQNLCALEQQNMLPQDSGKEWTRMMRTRFLAANNIPSSVQGVATHSPSTFDCESLWKCWNNGSDLMGNVPFLRWNHDEYYDPDPTCYLQSTCCTGGWAGGQVTKTSIQHFASVEGIALFDNRFFQISASEATGMEPQQRHILETSYEALAMGGYTKKKLMGSYIAVYTGCTHPEAAYINYCTGAGAGNQSQAITSNRTSFVLGIMGPSTSIDSEQASSAMALQVGCSAVAPNHGHRLDTGGYSESAIVGGVYISLTPYLWPRVNAYMNPVGRSLTFDEQANGWVLGESCSSMALKSYLEKVDGEYVAAAGNHLTTIIGYRMTNNGRGSSLASPHGPAIQENIADATKLARIDISDLDAVECHGSGGLLEDPLEVLSVRKVLRPNLDDKENSLVLGAVKTNIGSHDSATGMDSFLKVIYNTLYAVNAPNLHLKTVNPNMDYNQVEDAGLFINTEHVAYKERDSFHSWTSRGRGGSNTNIVCWWKSDAEKVTQGNLGLERQAFAFWPGGGGYLERDSAPNEAYYIVGSWNEWKKQDPMVKVSETTYTFMVTMGPNKFETFQIWLDGEPDRILHPGVRRAASGTTVSGPEELDVVFDMLWQIDARTTSAVYTPAPVSDGGDTSALVSEEAVIEVSTRDTGAPGDQYKVKLEVAGKYRAVSWKKVFSGGESDQKAAFSSGTYYVTGTFNGYDMTPMEASEKTPGLFTLEVSLGMRKTCEFYVVRNMDFDQTFNPPVNGASSGTEVLLESGGSSNFWRISGNANDKFLVEFARTADGMKVSWRQL